MRDKGYILRSKLWRFACMLGLPLTLVFLLLLHPLFVQKSFSATPLEQRLDLLKREILAAHPGVALSILVTETGGKGGKELLEINSKTGLIPASTVKILTSAAALQELGAEYRFPTEVFVDRLPTEENIGLDKSGGLVADRTADPENSDAPFSGSLYVRGYGDPSMIDERLGELAREVSRRGVAKIKDLVIDDSLFVNPSGARGEQPYHAGNSAVSLNHNCYALRVAPRGVGMRPHWELTPGAPYSVQPRAMTMRGNAALSVTQVPSSQGFSPAKLFRKKSGRLVIEGTEAQITLLGGIPNSEEMQTFYRTVPYVPSYFASVFKSSLEQSGVEIVGDVLVGGTPPEAKRLLTFYSKPLTEIVNDLNNYSNNFIAGQLQFALGQDESGYFRSERGLARISKIVTDAGYQENEFRVADAVGLDRTNRLSAEQLVRVLRTIHDDFSRFPQLIASFSRFGASGTLKDRLLLTPQDEASALRFELDGLQRRARSVWAKTGSLSDVSGLAGYMEVETGVRVAFAILINGLSKDEASRIEEQVLSVLIGARKQNPSDGIGVK